MGTAIVGTVLVVALTSGISRLVSQSTVYTPQMKTQISQNMQDSVQVVSSNVLSQNIKENGPIEAETVRIYDKARLNAFTISLLFMAFIALIAYTSARSLPAKQVSEATVSAD
jgi:hypothetical protein